MTSIARNGPIDFDPSAAKQVTLTDGEIRKAVASGQSVVYQSGYGHKVIDVPTPRYLLSRIDGLATALSAALERIASLEAQADEYARR